MRDGLEIWLMPATVSRVPTPQNAHQTPATTNGLPPLTDSWTTVEISGSTTVCASTNAMYITTPFRARATMEMEWTVPAVARRSAPGLDLERSVDGCRGCGRDPHRRL